MLKMSLKRSYGAVQAIREKFADYITVLKEALRDGAEASAAHTAGISLLQPQSGSAAAPDQPTPGASQYEPCSWNHPKLIVEAAQTLCRNQKKLAMMH